MRATRTQFALPALMVLLLSLAVAYLSFTREPAAAFLFPRLISVFMLALASWNFVRAVRGQSRVGSGVSREVLINIAPGLLVTLVYVFWAAKFLGFYLASFITLFLLFSLYDPESHKSLRVWIKRLLVTTAFMAIIYALFSLLLKVQTPRGIFM